MRLVATPISVLREEKIEFKPSLPRQKLSSIALLDMNVCHRFAMEFPQPFWSTHLRVPGIDASAVEKIGNDVTFSYVGEEDFQVEFENLWAVRKAPILVAVLSGGDVVDTYNDSSREEIQKKVKNIFAHIENNI